MGCHLPRCRGVFVVGIALILFNRIEWEKAPDPVRACVLCSAHQALAVNPVCCWWSGSNECLAVQRD